MAFVLFGILARLTKKKWKAYFAEQVRQSWVTFLLHLRDPNPEVSMECRATFRLCFPFLGLKRLQPVINKHLGGTARLKPEELQEDICRHLAKENAELLGNLYSTTITYFYSSWEGIRESTTTFDSSVYASKDHFSPFGHNLALGAYVQLIICHGSSFFSASLLPGIESPIL
ncbi:maestro heat-like repeat-containing protein family member 2B [Mauremys mutica]|uniref:maestro heat-like repeat-containing protein family member 2B n=1 Tax=Mauremys mutica TaxID=74926 RepID=UPI001D1666F5|nr:maestro heat-like repeat-containing protein family member 2B [Mauremys mutica]